MKLSYVPNSVTLLTAALFCLTACKKGNNLPATTYGTNIDSAYTSGAHEGAIETGANVADVVDNVSFPNVVTILFSNDDVTITNPLEGNGVSVTVNDGDVVINSVTEGVEYQLKGITANGSVTVYSNDKYKLFLNNVTITNNDGPAIDLKSTARAFVVVNEGTSNTLKDGAAYTDATASAAINALGTIIFSGTGKLNVTGNYKHAIFADKYIRVRDAVDINIINAVINGIYTTQGFIADSGKMTIAAMKNGILVFAGPVIVNGGNIYVECGNYGVAANYSYDDVSITPYININGGNVVVKSYGGTGISSASVLTINGGHIESQDVSKNYSAINAAKAVYINGGYTAARGLTGIHTDGNITITSGIVVAQSMVYGVSGLDCPGVLKFTGGMTVATGATTSMPDTSVSTINTLITGIVFHVESVNGNVEALTFGQQDSFQTLLYACSKLKSNTAYKFFSEGAVNTTEASGAMADSKDFTFRYFNLFRSGYYYNDFGNKPDTIVTVSSKLTHIGGTIIY